MDASMEISGHPNGSASAGRTFRWLAPIMGAVLLAILVYQFLAGSHHAASAEHAPPAMIAMVPFVGILLSIALLPLIPATSHWWEHNKNKLMTALGFAALVLAYYGFAFGRAKIAEVLQHAIVAEYLPFIILLFCLYVISGGICLKGDLPAHPATNTAFLGVGAFLASLIGTTGASMLLIRPLLSTNSERHRVTHTVIFFIFLVSNVGGCLTPLGDPPLFLGYLKGVPFFWTLGLWPEWLVCTLALLAIYFVWDTLVYRKEAPTDLILDETQRQPLRVKGAINLLWLLGVVACVALIKPGEPLPGLPWHAPHFLREILMLTFVGLSLVTTPKQARLDNKFNYTAILEVAALFVGIFICMQAPIEILNASGEHLSAYVNRNWHFFWATGALSSFLDNAPTYAVFLQMAQAMTHEGSGEVIRLAGGAVVQASWLTAVSLGAVFMGANTYIGNGPNFMVKSIAEQAGVKMPSFFGYMLYSVGILVPLFILITIVFM